MSDDESEDRLRALIEGLVSRLRRSVNEAELAEMEAELKHHRSSASIGGAGCLKVRAERSVPPMRLGALSW